MEIKTFKDLEFKAHSNGMGGIQAVMKFDNGHRISVVGGSAGLYGNGISTFEIWRSCDDDVKGHLTMDEVTQNMSELQMLGDDIPKNPLGY